MGLSHLKLHVETVQAPGGEEFAVRGLNLDDITAIVRGNLPVLSALFEKITDLQDGLPLDDMTQLAAGLFSSAPAAATQIIALGADEPDVSLARGLPFPVQLEALEKIGRLTFATEGGPKKVLETVIRVARGMNQTLASLRP